MKLDQVALKKALSQPVIIPDWLTVDGYANHGTLGTVKVLGYLGNVVNISLKGETYQVPIEQLEPAQNLLDLSAINHFPFREIASNWLDEIANIQIIQGNKGHQVSLPENLHPVLKEALRKIGIIQIYSHQAEAFEQLQNNKSVILSTTTGSGKSLSFILHCFQQAITANQTGICIYPLKALASDQLTKLNSLNQALPPEYQIWIAKATGDIDLKTRKGYFTGATHPHLLLVSPEVLHYQLYHTNNPYQKQWQEFLRKLGTIVVDETHTYQSSFGIHFANLMRRVRLACQNVGNQNTPNWILSTATIGNPLELGFHFTGIESENLVLIDKNGATTHEKTFITLNPNHAPNFSTINLLKDLIFQGLKGLVFVNSRSTAKELYSLASKQNISYAIDIFHGSLSPQKRQSLLEQLAQGKLTCLLTTNALEAGIDLTSLDYVILRGATSLNSLGQRAGRCGRNRPGLVIFVPDSNNHIDFYYANNPSRMRGEVEQLKINPNYPSILAKHIVVATAEGGIPANQITQLFGDKSDYLAAELLKQNQFYWSTNQRLWSKGFPHKTISLRGHNETQIQLIEQKTGEIIEEMNLIMAHREVHNQAIYLTTANGQTLPWRVIDFKETEFQALVELMDKDNRRTTPFIDLVVTAKSLLDSAKVIKTNQGNLRLSLLWGTIANQVTGYQEEVLLSSPTCYNKYCSRHHFSFSSSITNCPNCQQKLSQKLTINKETAVEFDEPLTAQFETPILKIEINEQLAEAISKEVSQIQQTIRGTYGEDIPRQLLPNFNTKAVTLALHSLAHIVTKAVPLVFLASDKDVSSFTDTQNTDNKGNANPNIVYIYDETADGNGTSEAIFTDFVTCANKAFELANSCDCRNNGCPKCLTIPSCPQQNQGLSKLLGTWLLQQIILS